MNTRMLIAVVVSMFVCQQVYGQTEDDPVMPEATELEGTWELVSEVYRGREQDIDDDLWRFEGNRWYWRSIDFPDWHLIDTFSVDPSEMPAEIDYGFGGWLGIYELDDDLLRVCFGPPRPDRFESSEDYATFLYVFRRVEEDDE